MDSQAKYATLTRGDADIYLRLPVNMKYEEKIWVFHTNSVLVLILGSCVWFTARGVGGWEGYGYVWRAA